MTALRYPPDGAYDLVLAVSVFTHLTASWSAWLVELHRVLADGGLPHGFAVPAHDGPPQGHGVVRMRRRPGTWSAAELEAAQ